MPLNAKGQKILAEMQEQYGAERGKEVFYASVSAGRISGVDTADALENPQNYRGGSAPATKLIRPTKANSQVTRSAYGGISGGANPQGAFANRVEVWGNESLGTGSAPLYEPAATVAELQANNRELWKHGVAPAADRRRGGTFRR